MSANWECVTQKLSLSPGDLLVIYTDGVTEANDASGNEFGEARLVDLVRANLALSPVQLITQIQSAVRSFSANRQFDDLTLVLARPASHRRRQRFSCSTRGHEFTACCKITIRCHPERSKGAAFRKMPREKQIPHSADSVRNDRMRVFS
jgi:hypothetical protein